MKTISNFYFSLLALAGLIFVTACGDDDEETPTPGPSIVLTPGDSEDQESFTGFVGDEITIDVTVDAAEGFNVLRVYRQVDGVNGDPLEQFSRSSGTTQAEFATDFTYAIQQEDINKSVYLVFEAVDDAGNTSTVDYEIIAEKRPTKKYETTLLYAPDADKTSKTFFSADDGKTYSSNDILGTEASVSPRIDFGYFYGKTFKATLASPDQYPYDYALDEWEERNATKIKRTTLTEQEYIEYETSAEMISKAFDEAEYGENEGQVRELTVGDILAFELADSKENKRGLIKVNAIDGTDGQNDHITIEVVVAE